MQNKCLGHVLEMKDDIIATTTLLGRTQGTRTVGKPRTFWINIYIDKNRNEMLSGKHRKDVIENCLTLNQTFNAYSDDDYDEIRISRAEKINKMIKIHDDY